MDDNLCRISCIPKLLKETVPIRKETYSLSMDSGISISELPSRYVISGLSQNTPLSTSHSTSRPLVSSRSVLSIVRTAKSLGNVVGRSQMATGACMVVYVNGNWAFRSWGQRGQKWRGLKLEWWAWWGFGCKGCFICWGHGRLIMNIGIFSSCDIEVIITVILFGG